MMTFNPANKRTLVAGLAIILLTNAFVFAGVAYNRSGEPESQVTLTERELQLPYRYESQTENTGIILALDYRIKGANRQGAPFLMYGGMYSDNIDWLDKNRLETLGVDVSRPLETERDKHYYRKHVEKEVILVAEYNGSAYQAALKLAQDNLEKSQQSFDSKPDDEQAGNRLDYAKDRLKTEQQAASRLFIIDAGLNPEALREKYTDRSQYLLLKGVIGVQVGTRDKQPYLTGYVKSLANVRVHVPLAGHHVLEPLMRESRNRQDDKPRYSVKLNVGKRLEPWVVNVEKLVNEKQ